MIRHDVDLGPANTLGLACRAERFAALGDLGEARRVLDEARRNGWPVSVLGGGSNLILRPWLPGLVVQADFADYWLEPLGTETVRVHVEAGMRWHTLVETLAAHELWGTENLALIPGRVGAAPIQNIGAYGVELADLLESVHVLYLDDGREAALSRGECAFAYRDSVFKHALDGRVLITRLVLRLSTRPAPRLDYGDLAARLGPSPSASEMVAAVSQVRREKLPDPALLGNAGSFFKNPVVAAKRAQALLAEYPAMPHFTLGDGRVKLAAGWLIDQCGLKGLREGHVGVHDRQALVLVHHGGGSVDELLTLANRVAATVVERFGVTLEREPRLLGRALP